MKYPYPIQDHTRAECYPAADALSPREWAWEFLRRNKEYQRLFDLFASIPNSWICPDGSEDDENGKWHGTPWLEFRFLENGAGWYADPPPYLGESHDEYKKRTNGGQVMTFVDYMAWRFKLNPSPADPRAPLPDGRFFSDFISDEEEAIRPAHIDVRRMPTARDNPAPWLELISCIEVISSPYTEGFAFDLRKPIDNQLDHVRRSLINAQRNLIAMRELDKDQIIKPTRYQRATYPRYIRLLDAAATGADLPKMAAVVFPDEPNTREEGTSVSAKVRNNIAEARRLRDGGYWGFLI